VESLAAKILASSNNLQETGLVQEKWPLATNWTLWKSLKRIDPPLQLPVPNTPGATRPLAGWWEVTIKAKQGKNDVDSVSFLVWPER
jgi:hypothetical protein